MKTRHFFGAMTLALASLTLASCSGGGSSDSGLFGALPGEMTQYESEMKALEEKAKDMNAYVMLSFDTFKAKSDFCNRFGYDPCLNIIKGEVFSDQVERVD